MEKETYHHGTLKKDLINNGLKLLNKEGSDGFSLRKVASMCGVSHSAPYKHFKNKEELIQAITLEAIHSFSVSLGTAVLKHPDQPADQIIEMGKQYVKFMVENPDYLKFLFFNFDHYPVQITNGEFTHLEGSPFQVFKTCAENYLDSIHADAKNQVVDILAMWSLVHGMAVLFVNKSITYDGDYLDLIGRMIIEKLNIKL